MFHEKLILQRDAVFKAAKYEFAEKKLVYKETGIIEEYNPGKTINIDPKDFGEKSTTMPPQGREDPYSNIKAYNNRTPKPGEETQYVGLPKIRNKDVAPTFDETGSFEAYFGGQKGLTRNAIKLTIRPPKPKPKHTFTSKTQAPAATKTPVKSEKKVSPNIRILSSLNDLDKTVEELEAASTKNEIPESIRTAKTPSRGTKKIEREIFEAIPRPTISKEATETKDEIPHNTKHIIKEGFSTLHTQFSINKENNRSVYLQPALLAKSQQDAEKLREQWEHEAEGAKPEFESYFNPVSGKEKLRDFIRKNSGGIKPDLEDIARNLNIKFFDEHRPNVISDEFLDMLQSVLHIAVLEFVDTKLKADLRNVKKSIKKGETEQTKKLIYAIKYGKVLRNPLKLFSIKEFREFFEKKYKIINEQKAATALE